MYADAPAESETGAISVTSFVQLDDVDGPCGRDLDMCCELVETDTPVDTRHAVLKKKGSPDAQLH